MFFHLSLLSLEIFRQFVVDLEEREHLPPVRFQALLAAAKRNVSTLLPGVVLPLLVLCLGPEPLVGVVPVKRVMGGPARSTS